MLPHLKILPERYRCLIYKSNSGKTLAFFCLPSGDTSLMPCEAQSCQGEFPNIRALTSQASMAHLVSPDGKQLAVFVNESGANCSSELQRNRPNGSRIVPSPDGAEGLPPSCCLSNVCRRPPPRSRLPVRVAHPEPHPVKAAHVGEGCGRGALAWP